jgi:hypothetical protein
LAWIWLRAGVRAVRALVPPRELPVAATVGILRPRAVIAPAVEHDLDPSALAAVWAHERAHIRRRDPLRIWIAQLITDLQWPSPQARRRLQLWLDALEMARDEEARIEGIDGADLAAGIVAVARLTRKSSGAIALAHRPGAALAHRIDRLLHPLPSAPQTALIGWRVPLVCCALTAAAVLGAEHGEWAVRAILLAGS